MASDRITNEKLAAGFAKARADRIAEQEIEIAAASPEARDCYDRLQRASADFAAYAAGLRNEGASK